MGKTRVGVLVRESLGGNKTAVSQSADLQQLTEKYNTFAKRIRSFIQALQQHKAAMLQLDKSRGLVVQHFAVFSKDTPVWESAGVMPSADRPADTVCSYTSIHDSLSAKSKAFATKYQQFIIEYVVEWEKVTTTRIDNGLKSTQELRRELDHYQKKVEGLRLTNNQAMAKGKSVKPDQAEKLKRNEEKLVQSKQYYNKASTDLCILIEEVVERSWRDLHPILVKCVQFDMTVAQDEAKTLQNLNRVIASLKEVATKQGLSAQPRLKDLATLKPELLSTRPGGILPQLEAGTETPATSPSGGSAVASPFYYGANVDTDINFNDKSNNSNNMGSYPVMATTQPSSGSAAGIYPIISADSNDFNLGGTGSGQLSFDKPTSFSQLNLTGNPAPAPTLDDVYGTNTNSMVVHSAPSTGNLNLNQLYGINSSSSNSKNSSNVGNAYNMTRHASFQHDTNTAGNDSQSMYSGYSYNTAPAAVPYMPPPSMPPPPPPSMPPPPPPNPNSGMYGPSSNLYGSTTTSSPWSTGTTTPTFSNVNSSSNNNSFYNYGTPSPSMYATPQSQANTNTNPFNH